MRRGGVQHMARVQCQPKGLPGRSARENCCTMRCLPRRCWLLAQLDQQCSAAALCAPRALLACAPEGQHVLQQQRQERHGTAQPASSASWMQPTPWWHTVDAAARRSLQTSACRHDGTRPSEPGPPGDGGDDGGDPHPFFPRLSQQNPVQARYEAAEVAKAYEGLFAAPWFELRDNPVDQVLNQAIKRPLRQLHSVVFRPILARMATIATEMVHNEVDGTFERQEFLDGASTAIHAIVDAWSARDWAMLRQVCTSRLVDRMQIALGELEQEQGLQLSSLAVRDLTDLRLASINLWTAQHVAKFDPDWASAVDVNTSKSWLVATVHVRDAALDATYKDAKTGEELPGSQVLYRSGSWLFARGPLPRGFSSQLHLPWRLLAVW